MTRTSDEKTFIRITNKDIYNKIEEWQQSNSAEHAELRSHIQQTNGKVKLNRWIASTALSISLILIGIILN